MATVADLPASARKLLLTNPGGNGGWTCEYSAADGKQAASWLVPFADIQAFRTACLSKEEEIVITEEPPVTINRVVPLVCPWDSALHAIGISGRSLTNPAGQVDLDPWAPGAVPPWELVVLTVRFGVLPYSFTDRPFVSVRYGGRSNVITLPHGSLKFAGNDERIDAPLGLPCFCQDLVVTWHEVTDLAAALAVIEPLAGMVNDEDLTVRGRTYVEGSLHFPEFDAEEAISFGGSRKAQLSFPVRWRPRPTWLEGVRRDATVDAIDPEPLPTGNLDPLFG